MKITKTLLSTAVLLALPLSLQAAPEPGTWYVGGKLGMSQIYGKNDHFTSKLPVGGVFAGYQANSYLAVEAGYDYMFRRRTSDSAFETVRTSGHGIPIAAKLSVPIVENQLDLFSRLGGTVVFQKFKLETKSNQGGRSESKTSLAPLLAAGLEYTFTPAWAARLEYQWTPRLRAVQANEKLGAHMATLGVNYRFNAL